MARGAFISIDGYSTVDQGVGVVKSKGSQSVRCDIDTLFNWWGNRPPDPVIEPIPVDENGVEHVLCAGYERGSHYAPRRAFNKHSGRKNGLDSECRQCRHDRNVRLKVTTFARMLTQTK